MHLWCIPIYSVSGRGKYDRGIEIFSQGKGGAFYERVVAFYYPPTQRIRSWLLQFILSALLSLSQRLLILNAPEVFCKCS